MCHYQETDISCRIIRPKAIWIRRWFPETIPGQRKVHSRIRKSQRKYWGRTVASKVEVRWMRQDLRILPVEAVLLSKATTGRSNVVAESGQLIQYCPKSYRKASNLASRQVLDKYYVVLFFCVGANLDVMSNRVFFEETCCVVSTGVGVAAKRG